jgi:hypothetical protein
MPSMHVQSALTRPWSQALLRSPAPRESSALSAPQLPRPKYSGSAPCRNDAKPRSYPLSSATPISDRTRRPPWTARLTEQQLAVAVAFVVPGQLRQVVKAVGGVVEDMRASAADCGSRKSGARGAARSCSCETGRSCIVGQEGGVTTTRW